MFTQEFILMSVLSTEEREMNRYSTCIECEEEEFNLLTTWKKLDKIKLEGNHLDAVLR